MLDYSFVSQIDNFAFTSGKYPILLIGSHAHSTNDILEKHTHLCDFLVKPFLDKINATYRYDFYTLENRVSRNIIDMNRKSARKNDEIDINDYFFRQTIRFICLYLKETYKKIPIIIDIHSYDEHDEWNEFNIMILEQTKKNMETNPILIKQTIDFFEDRNWAISVTSKHNQDDIVEELAYKKLAIPILLEFNEAIMGNDKQFNKLVKDFAEYLKYINKINFELKEIKQDAILSLDITDINSILDNRKYLKSINDSEIRNLLSKYYQSLEKIKEIKANKITKSKSDGIEYGYESFSDLSKNIDEFSNKGANDNEIIQNTIYTLSNQHDTIIIPIELIIIQIKILYGDINKKEFQEWGINEASLIERLVSEDINFGFIVPKYKNNPNIDEDILFNIYHFSNNKPNYYVFYLIAFNNMNNISKLGLEKDLKLLNDWINYGKIATDNKNDMKKIMKSINKQLF